MNEDSGIKKVREMVCDALDMLELYSGKDRQISGEEVVKQAKDKLDEVIGMIDRDWRAELPVMSGPKMSGPKKIWK